MKVDVHFKISDEVLSELDKYCSNQGVNRSSLIRNLIYIELAKKSYLGSEKKKAVGIGDTDD